LEEKKATTEVRSEVKGTIESGMVKLNELLTALPLCSVSGNRNLEVAGIALDSRNVREGYLFAALPGSRYDGHDYIEEARQRGAVASLVQREVANGGRICVVKVDDSRAALAALSDRFYGSPSKEIEVIGVTGTNGKTSVCYMLRDILRAAGRKPALIGTIEYLIGERSIPSERTTPEAPYVQAMMRAAVDKGCDSVITEVSSHALAQQRVACVDFSTAVFTNLGSDHLDFHGDHERYFAAKASLFTLPHLKRAIVNYDDRRGRTIEVGGETALSTYGMREGVTFRAVSVETGLNGSRFGVESRHGRLDINLPLLGLHNVYNALAAVATALTMQVPVETVTATLAKARPVPGRLEEVRCEKPYRVFIDYAHTEEALRNALLALRSGVGRGKLILVFGCGGDRDRKKRVPMGKAAAQLADFSFITSDNPRGENPLEIITEIAKGFRGQKGNYAEIPDRREAIAAALERAKKGDIVLVAGKGHERTQEIGSTVIPFNDRDVILELLG
jgi:UDP-N-acetylmuramoyl-L-alanyl-D-glutamate--2,6-diaminopimelate ligase